MPAAAGSQEFTVLLVNGVLNKLFTREMCKPDIVYVLDRGHRLHFWGFGSAPAFSRGNGLVSFIQDTE